MSEPTAEQPSELQPIPVAEFEGEFVRKFEGKLPQLALEMPVGYPRGTHLTMELEVRVRNVHYDEDRRGDLVRMHAFVLEEVKLRDAFDPATRPDNVGGNLASDAEEPWVAELLDFIEGHADEVHLDGLVVPDRLRDMVKAYFDAFGGVSTPVGTPAPYDPEVGF